MYTQSSQCSRASIRVGEWIELAKHPHYAQNPSMSDMGVRNSESPSRGDSPTGYLLEHRAMPARTPQNSAAPTVSNSRPGRLPSYADRKNVIGGNTDITTTISSFRNPPDNGGPPTRLHSNKMNGPPTHQTPRNIAMPTCLNPRFSARRPANMYAAANVVGRISVGTHQATPE